MGTVLGNDVALSLRSGSILSRSSIWKKMESNSGAISMKMVLVWLVISAGTGLCVLILNNATDFRRSRDMAGRPRPPLIRITANQSWRDAVRLYDAPAQPEALNAPVWDAEDYENEEYIGDWKQLETTIGPKIHREFLSVRPSPSGFREEDSGERAHLESNIGPNNHREFQPPHPSPSGVKSSYILEDIGKFQPPDKNEILQRMNGRPEFDIMPPITFLKKYRNPCWLDTNRSLKCLPKAYLLGFTKCATTDLWFKLTMHPSIRGGNVKEQHWWSKVRFLGKHKLSGKYAAYFGRSISNSIVKEKRIILDASPDSMWDPGRIALAKQDPKRVATTLVKAPRVLPASFIKEYTPDAKFIIIMRNPTERLYSHYLYEGTVTTAADYKPSLARSQARFHKVVQKMIINLRNCFKTRSVRDCVYDPKFLVQGQKTRVFLQIGLYVIFLSDWLKIIPRDQFFIIKTEEYSNNTQKVMSDLFDFLGLENDINGKSDQAIMETVLAASRPNPGSLHGVRIGEMWNATRTLLDDFYRPFNDALATLLEDKKYQWTH